MLRVALLLGLVLALAARGEEATQPRPVVAEKEYRAKRQAAFIAQWMEVKLPFETPAGFLARLLDTAREGDHRATAALGWEFHQRGDTGRAAMWLGRAAERENPFAAYLLGLIAPPKDGAAGLPMEIDWMQRAADAGFPDAQFEIALRFIQGKRAPLDPAQARDWYGRAAGQHYAPALCNLATMEMQAQGGPADLAAAEQHFGEAGELGLPQGYFGLGEVRRQQNRLAECIPPYEKAADAGIVDADFWLGCLALQLPDRPRDETKAAKHFIRAAAGGHFLAKIIAADIQRRGAGVDPDPQAPARLEPELAKVTDLQTIATIGGLFLEGKLVERDPAKALSYLRRAAIQGHAASQRWAGTLLATGEGGERDLEEAYQWLWLAARNGQTDAEPAFQAVLRAMDGNQIVHAARRAESFLPKPAPPAAKN